VAEQEAEPPLDFDTRVERSVAGQTADKLTLVVLSVRQNENLTSLRRLPALVDNRLGLSAASNGKGQPVHRSRSTASLM
jgi:hypothetical protein